MPRHTTPITDIHPHFQRLMEAHGCESLYALAKRFNIQPERLINIAKRTGGNPVIQTHLELAEAFSVEPEEWFRAVAE